MCLVEGFHECSTVFVPPLQKNGRAEIGVGPGTLPAGCGTAVVILEWEMGRTFGFAALGSWKGHVM